MAGAGAGLSLTDVAHTLNHHRAAQDSSPPSAPGTAGRPSRACGRWPRAAPADGVVDRTTARPRPGTVFVYSGQGSHWTGMGRRLLADEPVFAAAIDRLEPAFVDQVGFSLSRLLAEGAEVSGDAQVQPVIMGLAVGADRAVASRRAWSPTPSSDIRWARSRAAVVAGAL